MNQININFSIGGLKIRIRMGNNLKVRIAARNNRGLCDVPFFWQELNEIKGINAHSR